jgi:hypothetical protein
LNSLLFSFALPRHSLLSLFWRISLFLPKEPAIQRYSIDLFSPSILAFLRNFFLQNGDFFTFSSKNQLICFLPRVEKVKGVHAAKKAI